MIFFVLGLVSGCLALLLVQKLYEMWLLKSGHARIFSSEALVQEKKEAIELLRKHGIVVNKYYMPVLTVLDSVGLKAENSGDVVLALEKFNTESYVLTDLDGNQFGGIIPISSHTKKTAQLKKGLRLVK